MYSQFYGGISNKAISGIPSESGKADLLPNSRHQSWTETPG